MTSGPYGIFIVCCAALTFISPLLSLYLFVLVSPLAALNEALGWDPRTAWAVVLCIRGLWECWDTGSSYLPKNTTAIWVSLTAILIGELRFTATGLLPDDMEAAWSMLLYFVAGSCAIYGIWQLIRAKRQLHILFRVFATSVLIASTIGLVEALMKYHLGSPTDRISGPLGNPNYYATYLALAATILVQLIRFGGLNRIYGWLVCAVAALACALTLSRTGIMALSLGVTLALLIRPGAKILSARTIAVAGGAVLLAGLLIAGYLLDYRRSLTFSDDPRQTGLAEGAQAAEDLSRLQAFRYSVELTAENPVTGVGFGTFQARNYNANGLYVTTHDTVMEILVGSGLIGATLFLWLLLSLIRPLQLSSRRCLFPSAVALGVCSLFGDYLQSIELFVIFAILYLYARDVKPADIMSVSGAT